MILTFRMVINKNMIVSSFSLVQDSVTCSDSVSSPIPAKILKELHSSTFKILIGQSKPQSCQRSQYIATIAKISKCDARKCPEPDPERMWKLIIIALSASVPGILILIIVSSAVTIRFYYSVTRKSMFYRSDSIEPLHSDSTTSSSHKILRVGKVQAMK